MGGFAFKDNQGNSLTTFITKEKVKPTLDSFHQSVLKPVGIQEYVTLGSTGKKSRSGDLDIAVGPVDMSDPKKLKEYKNQILQKIQSLVGNENARLLGSNIAIKYPIVGEKDQFVQIDLMFTENPSTTEWLMSGAGDDEVKGVYRNLLLSFIAKLLSTENRKITISFPGGLQIKDSSGTSTSRTEDPKDIMKELGIFGKPSDISTFEKLVDHLVQRGDFSKEKLLQFESYIGRYLQNEETFSEAKKAIDYLKRSLNVVESFRKLFRLIVS